MFKFSLFSFILLASGICIPGEKKPKFVVFHKHHDPRQSPKVCHVYCFEQYIKKASCEPIVDGVASSKEKLFGLPRIFYGTGITSVACKGCRLKISEKCDWKKSETSNY